MKSLRLSVFILLQFFCLYHVNADNLKAVRVIVNGEIITEFEVRSRVAEAFYLAEENYTGEELLRKKQELIYNAVEELIDRRILVQEAEKTILSDPAKSESVEKQLESFVKGAIDEVGSLFKFYDLAHKQGINPMKKRAELKKDIMVDEILRENVYRKIIVTPRRMKRYYEEHIDDYSEEGSLSFRQILVRFSSYDSREEAKTFAETLLKKLEDGEIFADIAKEFSEGPHSYKGGLWGFDEVKDFRKDLVEDIMKLRKDEISKVVETAIGYHIFKVEDIIHAKTLSFEEAQDKIYQILFRDEFLKKKREYLQKLKKNVVIKRFY
ncbi:MAG: peptidyl-prolyl cis-trans isomerase [Candidatus Scalindua sp.]|nr:peptidyl-prolyl cis-trans isomerase [Candidatus Scalindua sp.]